jgi:ABC-type transport system involved in multi-copper enzyme maturation permease subunit
MFAGPVFTAELTTTARRARYYAIRFVYGMILLFFVVQAAGDWQVRRGVGALWEGGELSIREMAKIGRNIFVTFAFLQGGAVLVLTPSIVAGVVADEKQRKTLHYLMASRLNSVEIILGKLFARLLHVGIFLAVGLPVMSLISLFGGVEPMVVVMVYGGTVSTACFLATLAMLISTLARRPRDAHSQVYILELAWLFCPAMVAWLMPAAGGRWAQLYSWIEPVNNVLRWTSPLSLVDPSARSNPVDAYLWTIGLQGAFAAGFVALAILLLRPTFRREGDGGSRIGWLYEVRRGRRFLPRPDVGDDAMLWKERYVSRTSGIMKVAAGIVLLIVAACLGYGTYQYAEPAFRELWEYGYTVSGPRQDRQGFNVYLRIICTLLYVVWCLGIASVAATAVVSEREEDTWMSLTATPLGGLEILRAKMFGAVWGTRWIGLLLAAFWLLGVLSGAVHPLGLIAVSLETPVYVWFTAALGVWFSLTSRTSLRAQTTTMGILLFINGIYQLCCIPLSPNTPIFALGVTPMVEALSLVSYEDLPTVINADSRRQFEAVITCVLSSLAYGAAALLLTLNAFATFDAKIDRPRRGWHHPRVTVKEDLTGLREFTE